jgi:hypothetical protein
MKRFRPTLNDMQMLCSFMKGKSIGFSAKASLKAKGLLPRSSGQYILGPKYSGTGKPLIIGKRTTRKNIKLNCKNNLK